MKKIILFLVLSITVYQANAQTSACAYTYTQTNNTVVFSHVWPLALIYTLDSVRIDFGDGNSTLHTLPVPATTNHTYLAPGVYNACLTRYISQIGSSVPIACLYCDSIVIQGSTGCSVAMNTTVSGTTATATATASGGTAPYLYSYTLNPGSISSSTGIYTGLTNGTYTVCAIAIDANQNTCVGCDTFIIGSTSNCTTTIAATSSGSTINATAIANFGTPPYTYSYTLNPGNITNSSGTFTGLALGNYTVCAVATDSNNQMCTSDCDSLFAGISFVCNTTLSLSSSGNTITSTPTTTGGTAPYTYSYTLNPGNITNSTGIFTGLANGQYVVCVSSIDALQNTCSTGCDSIFVQGGTSGCTTTIQSVVNGTTITSTATATGGSPGYTFSYTLNPGNITNSTGIFPGLAPGSYGICATATDSMNNICSTDCDSAFIQGSGGCNISASYTQNVSGLNITLVNGTNCTGCAGAMNYAWSFGDGNTSTMTSPTHTYAAAGNYSICLVATGVDANQNPCIDSICKNIQVGSFLGINNIKKNTLKVYPNPTNGLFSIELPKGEKSISLKVNDLAGRTIIEREVPNSLTSTLQLDIKDYAEGIYLIKLQTNRHIYTSTIVNQE